MSDIYGIGSANYSGSQQQQKRVAKDTLDKEDFLRILITQLTHQDPTQPMEDREFIAQMAQFTSLEQMTNLNKEFSKVANIIAMSQAVALIGKTVDVNVEGIDESGQKSITTISGRVDEVTGGESPKVFINGSYYDYAAVARIRE